MSFHLAAEGPDRGAALLEMLASGNPTPDVLQTLWRASQDWLAAGGELPLERFLRLPSTPGATRKASRNLWIKRAAELIAPGANAFHQAARLEEDLGVFISRGQWSIWRKAKEPPQDASALRRALFHIARYNEGKGISARHISRIIAKK